jgi:hypothetical protein
VLAALSGETPDETPDAVPVLFLRTWERLGSLAAERLPRACRPRRRSAFTSFVAAGDALAVAPAPRPDRSAWRSPLDGLRRLARMIDPSAPGDPLDYEDAVDPELRTLFGLGEPPPPPDIAPDVDLERALVAGACRRPPPWIPGRSDALNGWIPGASDLDAYLRAVRELARHRARGYSSAKMPLDERFRPLFPQSGLRDGVAGELLAPVRPQGGKAAAPSVARRLDRHHAGERARVAPACTTAAA